MSEGADEEGEKVEEIVDKAIAKGRTVKDVLVEMKDTSELMVDLAYSALLTNSKELAEEIRSLERRMDDLRYEIEALLLLAARGPENAAELSGILHVVVAAEEIADAAEEIADVVLRGVADHPIYQQVLGEAEEKVAKVLVKEGSELAGRTIGEVRVSSRTGCYVRAIKRGTRWVYTPGKDTKVLEGDVLIATGSASSIMALEELCKPK